MPTLALRSMLWILVALLGGLGLVMVASTTVTTGPELGQLHYRNLIVQAIAMAVGLGMAIALSRLGTEWLRNTWVVAIVATGCALALAVTPHLGKSVYGATRWIDLGPVNIQPAELAKLGFILVLAWYLTRVEEKVRVTYNGVIVPIIAFAIAAVLVYRTKDLGSVIVLAGLLWFMLFYAGANWLLSSFLALLAAPLAIYVSVFQSSYRFNRIMAFRDPMNPDIEAAYHLRQSFIAIASGGLFGTGLGQGPSRAQFLPERHTDFIYAVICEELGMVGGLVVAGLFLALVGVGFAIAARSVNRHQRLLAVGMTSLLGIQAFWNMLVVVGSLPTKGLTLPLISYGGSSVVVCLVAIGVLDAVARQCPDAQPVRARAPLGATTVRTPTRSATEAW